MCRSYRQIIEITGAVEALVRSRQGQFKQPVILYGPADEVEQILKICLRDLGFTFRQCRPEHELPPLEENQLVLTWRFEEEEKLPNRAINILNLILKQLCLRRKSIRLLTCVTASQEKG